MKRYLRYEQMEENTQERLRGCREENETETE
jgi:hypothetical protein